LLMLFGVLFFKIAIFKLLSLGLVPVFGTALNANVITLPQMLIAAVIDVVYLLFNVFIFALIIRAIMSWIPAMQGNPVQDLLAAITDPVLKPIRGFLPPMGGLDLSVFFTIVLLFAARIIVIGYAQALL